MSQYVPSKILVFLAPLVIGLLTPAAILLLALLMSDKSVAEYAAEFADALTRKKLNLLMITALNMVPFLLLMGVLGLYLRKSDSFRGLFLLMGGVLGILVITIPTHLDYWPSHLRGATLGWPHGLEFILAPILSVPAMGVGVAIGWLMSKKLL